MTHAIKTLVVDDEPMARARMLSLLREETDIDVVGECSNGPEAVAAIRADTPDLVFLDIQMAEMNGLELARSLGRSRPAIVFVTAHQEYALSAFEIHALDYVLKPFSRGRFKAALAHAREHVARSRARADGREVPSRPETPSHRERLVIRSSGRIFFVSSADIDWCEAAGNYVRIHVGPQVHFVRETMGQLAKQLNPARFARIHRSTIVNLDRVQELRSSFNGEYVVVLRGGTRLTLSRGYREALQAQVGKPL